MFSAWNCNATNFYVLNKWKTEKFYIFHWHNQEVNYVVVCISNMWVNEPSWCEKINTLYKICKGKWIYKCQFDIFFVGEGKALGKA